MMCGQTPFPLSRKTENKMRTFGEGVGSLPNTSNEVYAVVVVFRDDKDGKSIVPNYERIFHKRDLAINDASGWINASGRGTQLVGLVVMRDGFIVSWHVLYRKAEE